MKIEMPYRKTKKNPNSKYYRADFALQADILIKVSNFSFES